jgi:hypothetical protein
MRSQHHAPISSPYTDAAGRSGPDDRGNIDEALFAGEAAFAPPGIATVSDDVAAQTLLGDEPHLFFPPLDSSVPGMRLVEARFPVELTTQPNVSYRVAENDDCPTAVPPREQVSLPTLPPRPAPVLAVNSGMMLSTGDTAAITADRLRLTGGDPAMLDMMVLSAPLHGAIVRDGFALTGGDVFTQEDVNQNRLYYRHDGGTQERDSFTFASPDGEVEATVFAIRIEPTRRAPELLGDGQLATVLDACRVTEILDGLARCREPGFQAGLAVVGATGRGQWQYSLDGGANWLDLGDVHHGQSRLLGDRDLLRFVPQQSWSGAVKLTYHAWDQTTGNPGEVASLTSRTATGGLTAFSRTSASATTTLAPPPFDPGKPVEPWADTPTVGELFGEAVAVVRVTGPGTWQFSLDDGRTWRDFGPVYHGRARLLRPCDRVRFRRRRGAAGKVVFAGRPWDGRGGSPGATAGLAGHGSHGKGTCFGAFVRSRNWEIEEE